MNETETICKNCEYYYKEHCCSGDSVMCTYTVSEDFRCEWWEEKSRMKTWQMIKELTENPEKTFKLMGEDDVVLKCDGDNYINLSDIDYLEPQTDRWEEVKKPVDFMTAIKSGRRIGYKYERGKIKKMSLPNLFYELQQDYSDKVIRQMILNGKWYIED